MQSHRVQVLTSTSRHFYYKKVALAESQPSSEIHEYPHHWSDGRKHFLQQHRERYLQRLSVLRENLWKEKDFVRPKLPKNFDKSAGFWEAIMEDLANTTIGHKAGNSKSQRPPQGSDGGRFSNEQKRRCHLERLRRIRIMQMRRKVPPQLEPLHGIGLGSKKDSKTSKADKQMLLEPPTTYHINWMEGSSFITPVADQKRAFALWTQKNLGTVDVEPRDKNEDKFPNDIRTLLRRTCYLPNSTTKSAREREQVSVKTVASSNSQSHHTRRSTCIRFDKLSDTQCTEKKSEKIIHEVFFSPPLPTSPPSSETPLMSEIISHHSSSSSRAGSGTLLPHSDNISAEVMEDDVICEKLTKNESEEVQLVDKASSPVGFRLSPLEKSTGTKISSSATSSSKRRIVVKIPHGDK